ncbi:glycoside hydrolase [Ramicandelaber brevisporus]|nr:glycoside hydrolase [Ramicandelaber brevisporus]
MPLRANSVDTSKIRGVNIGGWLVLEPWIRPSLFKQFEGLPAAEQAVDEWELCAKLGRAEAKKLLIKHYDEWVTEADFKELASYGINLVRIPIGYWGVISLLDDEPYAGNGIQLSYLHKAVQWAKKHKMRVIVDLHGAPGSQNGFDNSGRRGNIAWHLKTNNVDRTLVAVKQLAREFQHDTDTVVMIQPLNEPAGWAIGQKFITSFYDDAYNVIKTEHQDYTVDLHTGFFELSEWEQLKNQHWNGAVLDTHIYHCFTPDVLKLSEDEHLKHAAEDGEKIARSNGATMPTMVGEWSLAITDCTKWLNGFGRLARYNGSYADPDAKPVVYGSCKGKSGQAADFTPEYKAFLAKFFAAQRDAYENNGLGWIFWNFKAEQAGEWDYIAGVRNGWIPSKFD